jgi:hypothetical protein
LGPSLDCDLVAIAPRVQLDAPPSADLQMKLQAKPARVFQGRDELVLDEIGVVRPVPW